MRRCAIFMRANSFAKVEIRDNNGALTVVIQENPVINRIVLEGNKRLKEDKIRARDQDGAAPDLHPVQGPR